MVRRERLDSPISKPVAIPQGSTLVLRRVKEGRSAACSLNTAERVLTRNLVAWACLVAVDQETSSMSSPIATIEPACDSS